MGRRIEVSHVHVGDVQTLPDLPRRHFDFEQHELLLLTVNLAHVQRHVLPHHVRFTTQEPEWFDAGCATNADFHVLRDDREDIAEFGIEYLRQLSGVFDEGVAAVAHAGEARHQILVVAQAETDRRHADALLGERSAELAEFGGRARSYVRQAVGEQNHPVDSIAVEKFLDLLGALCRAGK